jgi:aryl-alcohol dehydrogenase-like predicted oxidoreductase
MRTRKIGQVTVSAIGLGGMPMSIEGRPDEQRAVRTIHAAPTPTTCRRARPGTTSG